MGASLAETGSFGPTTATFKISQGFHFFPTPFPEWGTFRKGPKRRCPYHLEGESKGQLLSAASKVLKFKFMTFLKTVL